MQVVIKETAKQVDHVIFNRTIGDKYMENIKHFNDKITKSLPNLLSAASTDMGNVTHVIPGIHPCYTIHTTEFNHTRPFTAAAGKTYFFYNFIKKSYTRFI